jgi:hypothetical protein
MTKPKLQREIDPRLTNMALEVFDIKKVAISMSSPIKEAQSNP